MKNCLRLFISGLFLVLSQSAFSSIIVDVDYTLFSGSTSYEGNFSGEDSNNNGLLESAELTSFVSDYFYANHGDLLDNGWVDFGDFNIATNTWVANAINWYTDYNAYFTWNNKQNSWNTGWLIGVSTTITSQSNAIPEPSILALMGLGIFGLGLSRRKMTK